MTTIDERIVEMKFNTKNFEQGTQTTLDGIDKLNDALKMDGVADGLDKASSKFSIFGSIAFSALQRLTNEAINLGAKLAGAILDPLIEGGKKRALNIEQAKFQFQGLGMDVEQSMDDALYAVKGTAFGLDEAAVAASQFGASGIKSGDEMKSALRGIAGVAAMAGSSYTDMSNVFTKVAGQGRLMGDDLNRLGTRGINAASTLADYLNKTGQAAGATEASVRDMVTKGQIDFATFAAAMSDAFGEHATKANETYTGSLSNMRAAIARIGAAYFTPDLERQRKLFNALTPVIDGAAEALNPFIEGLAKIQDASMDQLVRIIDLLGFKDLTDDFTPPIIEGLIGILDTFLKIIQPIKDAFSEIFPPATEEQIRGIGQAILDFSKSFQISSETADALKRTFKGVFAIFDIVGSVVWEVIKILGNLFGVTMGGAGSILEITAVIGDFLVALRDVIKGGGRLTDFFKGLGTILQIPIEGVKILLGVLAALVGGFGEIGKSGIGGVLDGIKSRLGSFVQLGSAMRAVWDGTLKVFSAISSFLAPMIDMFSELFGDLGKNISTAMKNMDFNMALDAINTGLLGGIVLLFRKFINGGLSIDFGGGLLDSVRGVFDGLTDSLSNMQASVKAGTLMKIAGAVALLTASVVALSIIDSAKLTSALTGLTVMFGQLVGAMYLLERSMNPKTVAQLTTLGVALMLVAGAMLILSFAVVKLSTLSWGDLTKGLAGVVVLLGALVGVSKAMQGMQGGLIATGIGLIAISIALNILVSAVTNLAGLSIEELIKGLASVGVLMGMIVGFTKLMGNPAGIVGTSVALILLGAALNILAAAVVTLGSMSIESLMVGLAGMATILTMVALAMNMLPKNMILTAAALVLVGISLTMFADVMQSLGSMSWESIAKALVALAGGLVILAGAMYLMTGAIAGAASLVIAALAIMVLVPALQALGTMSWEEIAKGLVMLAGSLLIIAGAMYLMTAALPGAAALLVVAVALTILLPVLQALGGMTWDQIGMGLGALAAALGLLAIAGMLITPAVPGLMGLGAAIMLLGLGAALAGAGILALSIGLGALAVSGAAGGAALVGIIAGLLSLIPLVFEEIGKGVLAMAAVIGEGAPALVEALVAVLMALIEAIDKVIPAAVDMIVNLIMKLVDVLVTNVPLLVDGGLKLINGILDGIASNIAGIVEAAITIIANFINGIAAGLPKIIEAGVNLIISFVEGLASAIRKNTDRMNSAGRDLASAIIEGMSSGIFGGVSMIVDAARSIANSVLDTIKSTLGIASPSKETKKLGKFTMEGFSSGLESNMGMVEGAADNIGKTTMDALSEALSAVSDMVDGEVDMNPTITPVLDLSQVKNQAGALDGLLDGSFAPITSAGQASQISQMRDHQSANEGIQNGSENGALSSFNFTQNNYSPKALEPVEIYRRTKSSVATVKEALSANTGATANTRRRVS